VVEVTVVQYPGLPKPNWYLREVHDGRVVHWGPWMTEWAAAQLGKILAVRRENARRRANG
jgi:hypothetical protein